MGIWNSKVEQDPDLMPIEHQKLLDLDYQPVMKLGNGSFGTAWLIRDTKKNELLVLKLISDRVKGSLARVIKRETTILLPFSNVLANFNVIKYLDYGFVDFNGKTERAILMEYFPGEALDYVLTSYRDRNKAMTRVEFYNIAQKLFSAISFIHRHDIVHRDIKPDNILYDQKTGDLRLIDFGFACNSSWPVQNTDTTCLFDYQVMTPQYIYPGLLRYIIDLAKSDQQSQGYDYDKNLQNRINNGDEYLMRLKDADVWACGVTLLVVATYDLPIWNQAVKALKSGLPNLYIDNVEAHLSKGAYSSNQFVSMFDKYGIIESCLGLRGADIITAADALEMCNDALRHVQIKT